MRVTALVFGTLALLAPSLAGAETKTTVYTYNQDGALTSITETTEGALGSTEVTYFTWDNFEPDPTTPSTGTVTAANGNLIGYGPSPGDESEWSGHYDLLDRLVQVTNAQGQRAWYRYHPDELLAASLNANAPEMDGLQHYYDESRYPQVTNLYDRHTGTLSSRHQRIRYLQDGTEQMLVRHRKDVDGIYDLGAQTMSGNGYDPYGASLAQTITAIDSYPLYDLATNPYQYTDELRDPVSEAYYLRARWYLPGHQTFLQRDAVRSLNRHGYADGNPIMKLDPSGNTSEFLRGFEAPWKTAFGLTQLPSVFMHPFKNRRNAEIFLTTIVQGVATLAGGGTQVFGLAAGFSRLTRNIGLLASLATLTDQTIVPVLEDKQKGSFVAGGFLAGMALEAGARLSLAGIQVGGGALVSAGRSSSFGDEEFLKTQLNELQEGETAVFHQKSKAFRVLNHENPALSPYSQTFHSSVVSFTKTGADAFRLAFNEVNVGGLLNPFLGGGRSLAADFDMDADTAVATLKEQFNGKLSWKHVRTLSYDPHIEAMNPAGFQAMESGRFVQIDNPGAMHFTGSNSYRLTVSNCHINAIAIIQQVKALSNNPLQ